MLITIPSDVLGGEPVSSVLDLEPLLEFARQCRPDAVSLMPPIGADDQPNGAALCAMKDRLDREGIRTVPGWWEPAAVQSSASAAWVAQNLFEARALIAALGEAGVEPLVLRWRLPAGSAALGPAARELLDGLVDESERSQVRLALHIPGHAESVGEILTSIRSPRLGAACEVGGGQDSSKYVHALRDRMYSIQAAKPHAGAARWRKLGSVLRESAYEGPITISGLETPIEYAHAIGLLRGAMSLL